MNRQHFIAQALSFILHPIFMAVYGVLLLFAYEGVYTNFETFIRFMLPIIILSCILPANGIFLFKRFRLIKDYAMSDKRDRLLPFLFTFLCYVLLLYYFMQPYIPIWFLAMLATPLILLLLAGIITFFWKISAHMMGIGGLIGCVLSISYNVKGISPFGLFIVLFILAGCLGTSRLLLKRHTPAQVYAGFALGFIVSYICIYWGAYFTIFGF
ncbi:hypothetical protein [Dysgonomonas sp. 25]|uniref:hypothetical protein n=1 Tax=Dysgonomonas sp. 25 TaxID=2302933 RepID=UPI0013D4527A|nr:hypothetical protein [Dysgonomonas sp. 25]NDV69896.1 hypothetical protein [Dysgonomonas sp. 25]